MSILLAPAASIGYQDSGVLSFSLEEMARAQSSEKTANHVSVVSQLDFKKNNTLTSNHDITKLIYLLQVWPTLQCSLQH